MTSSLYLILQLFGLDFKIHRKYPSRIVFAFFQIFLMIFLFYYISKTLGEIPLLNGSYFPFVASGLAFQYFFSGVVNASSEKLTEFRDYGVLEELLFSRYAPWVVILSSGFYSIAFAIIKSLLVLAAISYVFSFSVHTKELLLCLGLGFLLALNLSFVASCSFLLWKRFSLLEIGGSLVTLFLSGVYFPVSVLPPSIATLAQANPLLQCIHLFRAALGVHQAGTVSSLQMVLPIALAILVVFGANIFLYRLTIEKIKNSGLSSHF